MQTRAGWIALVLTGGLALAFAPAVGRAQFPNGLDVGGRDAPLFPLPLSSNRPEDGGFYTALEYKMLRMTKTIGNQPLAVRGFVDVDGSVQRDLGGSFIIVGTTVVFNPGPPGPPGAFLGSGAEALNVNQLATDWTYGPGYELTLGYRFENGWAVEANWTQIFSVKYTAGADSIPPGFAVGPVLADTFLFSPVVNFPIQYAGPASRLGVGNPGATYGIWNAASSMTEQYTQRYNEGNILGRYPVLTSDVSRTNVYVGYRFSWIWENFRWDTVARDFAGNATAADHAIYNNIVSNRMYGPFIGAGQEFYLGKGFAIELAIDQAAMLDIVKERATYSLADRSTEAKKQMVEYSFAPETEGKIDLTWYPTRGIQFRLGWDFMMFLNTVSNPYPVSFDFNNFNNFTNTAAGQPFAGLFNITHPIFERIAIRYMDAIHGGVTFTW
ncbi:MAG TPA: Lpg1974 family pore-forming outer membrane protein [Gemmataceae bacterium]|nr:Lpg1974 family pore-forming outer membrane protein [Gemmataceae bacterium]